MNLRKILLRSISGLIYIGIIVGAIMCGTEGISVLAVVFGALATIEFTKITKGISYTSLPTLIADVASTGFLALSFFIFPLILWILCLIVRLIIQLYIETDKPLKDLAYSLMTQLYIGIPMALMVGIAVFYGVPHLMLAIFIFIWLNDTGAFLIGCSIGRHRLFPSVSPKKSWEGFFGGLIFSIGASILIGQLWPGFFGMGNDIWKWGGLAVVVSVFGTWGDLIESMIKRSLSIKDSGTMIPGHGGILDRIDSLLLVTPAAFLYIYFIEILF